MIILATIFVALIVALLLPTKTTVAFSAPQAETNGTTFPMRKVAFYVTNTASRAVFLQVAAIERNTASAWLADTQALPANTFRALGKVGPNATVRLSFELSHETVPTRLRVLVSPDATTVQKAGFALRRFWANFRGQGTYKQLWFHNLAVPSYQVVTPEIL